MVPMCTFSFFFFDLVPLFFGAMIFAAGNVRTYFLSDEGVGVVFCAFRVIDAVTSGLVCADTVCFNAVAFDLVFADAVGFEAVSFFRQFI